MGTDDQIVINTSDLQLTAIKWLQLEPPLYKMQILKFGTQLICTLCGCQMSLADAQVTKLIYIFLKGPGP